MRDKTKNYFVDVLNVIVSIALCVVCVYCAWTYGQDSRTIMALCALGGWSLVAPYLHKKFK